MKRPVQHEHVIVCRKMKFHIGDNVVYTGEGCSRGEVVTVVEVRKRWIVVKGKVGYCCTVLKSKCLTMAEAKEQALNPKVTAQQEQVTESMWALMGGYPACMNCGCSPADWEEGFPPYCHSCGARMKNGRK